MLGVKLPANLQADFDLLFAAVQEAGTLGLTMLKQNVRRWSKPDGSTVTQADIEIDGLLKSRLHDPRPDYGWLSEETIDTQWKADRIFEPQSNQSALKDRWRRAVDGRVSRPQ